MFINETTSLNRLDYFAFKEFLFNIYLLLIFLFFIFYSCFTVFFY